MTVAFITGVVLVSLLCCGSGNLATSTTTSTTSVVAAHATQCVSKVDNRTYACQQEDAICCTYLDLNDLGRSSQFFCCPKSLPVCDFSMNTCRQTSVTTTTTSPPPRWACTVCHHTYDADVDGGGKPFADLPDSWKCPVCGQPKSAYQMEVGLIPPLMHPVLSKKASAMDLWRSGTSKPRMYWRASRVSDLPVMFNSQTGGRVSRACESWALGELQVLASHVYSERDSNFNHLYRARGDRRMLRHTREQYNTTWITTPSDVESRDAIRDHLCRFILLLSFHHVPEVRRQTLGLLPQMPVSTRPSATALPAELTSQVAESISCTSCHVQHEVSDATLASGQCPPSRSRCLPPGRLGCDPTGAAGDAAQCCDGLVCSMWWSPANELQLPRNTTSCVKPDQAAFVVNSSEQLPVNYSEWPTKVPLSTPPVLPANFSADLKFYNDTDGTVQRGRLFFQEGRDGQLARMRTDFDSCPFLQLRESLAANYGPCSVIYSENKVRYVYHEKKVSCLYCHQDAVIAWHADQFCTTDPLYSNGTLLHAGQEKAVERWAVEWQWAAWMLPRNVRTWYFAAGTNHPVRFCDDLSDGCVDLLNLSLAKLPDDAFGHTSTDASEYSCDGQYCNRKNLCGGTASGKDVCTHVAGTNRPMLWYHQKDGPLVI